VDGTVGVAAEEAADPDIDKDPVGLGGLYYPERVVEALTAT
tara:strand:+ start:274 stop:396 length:123 start_codon:yes stop_codon:yes gene_type:complete